MGTRSLTYVYNEADKPVVCMYAQYDGYPSGVGRELAEFLNSKTIINGFVPGDNSDKANGMGCLAAQLIAQFKTGIGGHYLYPVELGQDAGQDYEYHIRQDSVTVYEGVECGGNGTPLFQDSWQRLHDILHHG